MNDHPASRLRILFVTPYPPARDGIGKYSQLFCGALTELGHAVGVVTASREPNPPDEVISGLGRDADGLRQTLAAIKAFEPDLVHVQFGVAAYGTGTFALIRLLTSMRRAGYPIVITLHEVTRDTGSLRGFGRRLYRTVCGTASRLIVHTETAQRCLESLLPSASEPPREVIGHPRPALPPSASTSADVRREFSLGESPIILAFGFLDIDKGLQDLIRASSVLEPSSNARLVIAGSVRKRAGLFRVFEMRDRVYELFLRTLVRRKDLSSKVVFVEYVPDESVAAWFELASLVVLPYRRSEQSGVASLALAAGTPLLTTSVGELASMSTVPAVQPRSPVQLAAAIDAFLNEDTGERSSRAPASDLADIVARTVAAYDSTLADAVRSSGGPRGYTADN